MNGTTVPSAVHLRLVWQGSVWLVLGGCVSKGDGEERASRDSGASHGATALDTGTAPPPAQDTGADAAQDTAGDAAMDTGLDSGLERVVTFDALYDEVLAERCLHCHGQGSGLGGLLLEPAETAQANLRAQFSITGQPLVVPGDPATSYLYLKVSADPSIEGVGMPTVLGLDEEGRALVWYWIAGLASE